MKRFANFLTEQYLPEAKEQQGHGHIEHISDVGAFDGPEGTKKAVHALKSFHGTPSSAPKATRKVDDRMSFHVSRTPNGHTGVKYKGSGAKWYWHNGTPEGIKKTHAEIDKDLEHKPYMAHMLKHLTSHVHKVIKRPGTWQGGYMHDPDSRHEVGKKIHFKPNTINYSIPSDSEEGKKVKKSKVGIALHTELKAPNGKPVPVLKDNEFHEHPDVHVMKHLISKDETKLQPRTHHDLATHIKAAHDLSKDRDTSHLKGHEIKLRTYTNSTVRNNTMPSSTGYHKWLEKHHDNKIDSVSSTAAKAKKAEEKNKDLAHVKANKEHFDKTFKLHHHLEQATDLLANHVTKHSHGGYGHDIEGKKTGPEGAVIHGHKIVKRRGGFSQANFARSDVLKKAKKT